MTGVVVKAIQAWARAHNISVGSVAAMFSTVAWLCGWLVAAVGDVTRFGGVPDWAMAAMSAVSSALLIVGRFAWASAREIGRRRDWSSGYPGDVVPAPEAPGTPGPDLGDGMPTSPDGGVVVHPAVPLDDDGVGA